MQKLKKKQKKTASGRVDNIVSISLSILSKPLTVKIPNFNNYNKIHHFHLPYHKQHDAMQQNFHVNEHQHQ